MVFKTDITSILAQVASIDPIAYGKTRNHLDGAVTYLSPYISRGVISTKQVLESVFKREYKLYQIESFVKELCWRDYFQRVGQEKNLSLPIKQAQDNVAHTQIPLAVMQAQTGIEGIDQAIAGLYQTGYMHNHARMYTASVVCNIAKSDWLMPAQWMYYHLLDGDWASNACSWQWVAAANSGKKYYANQENINKYTKTAQRHTFLDCTYEELAIMQIPDALKTLASFQPEPQDQFNHISNNHPLFINTDQLGTTHNQSLFINTDESVITTQPIFIYNYYNLDPYWHRDEPGTRILLLEPDFFEQYPISSKCWKFMMDLAAEIPNMQIYHGSFASLVKELQQIQQLAFSNSTANKINPSPTNLSEKIYFKEHPLNLGYQGIEEHRDWIVPTVQGYYPSFFAYWKAVEKLLKKNPLS
jgi:deoxyribodipyrimidine photo-lyase